MALAALISAACLAACGAEHTGEPGLSLVTEDPTDQPLRTATAAQLASFRQGDELFEITFRESDGLGPLYIRTSCAACHASGGKGPGLVRKLQVLEADGTPAAGAAELAWGHTLRPYAAGGATRPLDAPAGLPGDGGRRLALSVRVGPTVLGRGYIEAVDGLAIERLAAEQASRTDGIHGRVSRVTYRSQVSPGVPFPYSPGQPGLIGRFGLKARIATLDDFTADAFQGDMGLTSPLRPDELPNPEALLDDRHQGVDVDEQMVIAVSAYVRLLEIPARDPQAAVGLGPAVFERARCNVCHVPTLPTRPDYPVPQLAGIAAPLYSDLLLHDMGSDLADHIPEEGADAREWRTAPLMGLRFQRSYLHDGRARTLDEAIRMHAGPGSQANPSVQIYETLSAPERQALLQLVGSL